MIKLEQLEFNFTKELTRKSHEPLFIIESIFASAALAFNLSLLGHAYLKIVEPKPRWYQAIQNYQERTPPQLPIN